MIENPVIKKAIDIVGTQALLGKATNTAQSSVWKWLHNESKPSPEKVPLIVAATGGKIKAHELRPDLPHVFPPI